MQHFSIKDVENLTGIKAHTLRIWEQRYRFFAPKRKESTHRIYDNEDLKFLLRVSFLYHQGWKVSRIAALPPAQLLETVQRTIPNVHTYPHFITQLIEAALDFNEKDFALLIDRLSGEIGFERTMTEVCFPFLQRVGLLWMTNHLIPAQEHFSSYIIQNKVIAETEKLPLTSRPPQVLLFAPRHEFHELPLVYIHYLLRKRGWSVLFLGKNISLNVLQPFKELDSIQYLFIHLLTNLMQLDAETYIEQLVRLFPDKKIVASGAAVQQVQRQFMSVRLLHTDEAIRKFINREEVF